MGDSLYCCGGGKAAMIFRGAPHSPGIMYTVNTPVTVANNSRETGMYFKSLSLGSLSFPNKYMVSKPKITIQMAMNISLSSRCSCNTKSALDKNLKASASSKNPRTTFTELSHPPDLGKVFSHPGKAANNPNGSAMANEKPSIPMAGALPPFEAASTINVPTMGPVQEKETKAKVKAMKNIPMSPPRSARASALLIHELGKVISNAPKNEMAKTMSSAKNAKLNQGSVDISDKMDAPNAAVTPTPNTT